jgi:hypothetical protein
LTTLLAESTLAEVLPVVPVLLAVPVPVVLLEVLELPQAARLQVMAKVSASAKIFFILLILLFVRDRQVSIY